MSPQASLFLSLGIGTPFAELSALAAQLNGTYTQLPHRQPWLSRRASPQPASVVPSVSQPASTRTRDGMGAQSSKWPRRQISPPDAAADEPMPGAPGAHCGARSGQLQRRPCSRIPSGRFCRLCSGPSRLSLQCNGIMLCTAVTNTIAHVSLYP